MSRVTKAVLWTLCCVALFLALVWGPGRWVYQRLDAASQVYTFLAAPILDANNKPLMQGDHAVTRADLINAAAAQAVQSAQTQAAPKPPDLPKK